MPRKARLDAELVRRGLARSREHAASLIAAELVTVGGMVAVKSATGVDQGAPIQVREDSDPGWASRGAEKLLGALEMFEPRGLVVTGRRCLDAGASTGGFTDVLLRRAAREVVATDVGRGLLDWRLRTDERVIVLDRTNARDLTPELIGGAADVVVADLSFISLRLVLPAFARCVADGADVVPMIKPQFEVGKARLGRGGVVRDPALREEAVLEVLDSAREHGLHFRGVVASPLPGPSGNVEYFVWLRRPTGGAASRHAGEPAGEDVGDVAAAVRAAVQEGPR
ncbi:TlyA family RNA methyltransferase [Haloechinothrix sp. YIM 98757]|uniref:TlyA family RNA methyltransferase n=1 Tax=Haloechinothrix aidingensis TaxID=2752311 RepID=A0A838AG76_9PSEU|nr:TlyA family RNA methyltransferase [Haloechinothrix aidingensis]